MDLSQARKLKVATNLLEFRWTGHGIGLSIHEPTYLVRGDTILLAPGMCFSTGPMIVIPDRFGIRLEDHFHVTDEGAAWFTERSPSIDALFG